MSFCIRPEKPEDFVEIRILIEDAFKNEILSDHTEQLLVERLRKSPAYVPELAFVATDNNKIVGCLLLTKIKITNKTKESEALTLAPVAVLTEYQKRGIGSKLIKHAHQKAKELQFGSIFLVGHETYYPKFGYQLANKYSIQFPFDAPLINCMAIELYPKALESITGMITYPEAFFK